MAPLVSVVMPTNRDGSHLDVAVNSTVHALAGFSAELVLVCDGVDIGSRWGSRVRVVHIGPSGISSALNVGLQMSDGEYVARMDSDDICHPARFRGMLRHLVGGAFDLMAGGVVKFGDVRGPRWEKPPQTHGDFSETVLHAGYAIAHPAVVYRRRTVLEVGGYQSSMDGIEDLDLWLRLLDAGAHYSGVPDPAILYRVHPLQASRQAGAADRIAERLAIEPKALVPCGDGCPGRLSSFIAERSGNYAGVCRRRAVALGARSLIEAGALRKMQVRPLLKALPREASSRLMGARVMRRERHWVALL